ncbi:trigger factor, partial [Treponema pallidum]
AQVRVTLKALKQRQLPSLDDELAQDVSDAFRTLDDLTRSVRQNLAEALEAALHEYKRRQLLRILVRENPFSLPE